MQSRENNSRYRQASTGRRRPYNQVVLTPATDDLARILAFTLEADRLKTVPRKIRAQGTAAQVAEGAGVPVDGIPNRLENSAEHTWQLALFATTLQQFAADPVDMAHVLEMLLIHDLGEIDTGDTMAFVEGGWAERKQQERDAVRRIFGLLPADRAARFLALWDEFETGSTPESRFANAVDRAMPPLHNLQHGGGSWVEHGIHHDRVVARVRDQIAAGCPALWTYLQAQLQAAQDAGWFGTHPPT